MENATLRRRLAKADSEKNTEERNEAEHNVEIKQELEKELVDYSRFQSSEEKTQLIKKPWKKFPFNNIILRSTGTYCILRPPAVAVAV